MYYREAYYIGGATMVTMTDSETEADIEEAAILRCIVAFLLAYCESRGLAIDETSEQVEREDADVLVS